MEAEPKIISYYMDVSGACPFRDWRERATTPEIRAMVDARIARFRTGNFGDHKPIGDGAQESRIFSGPGYRIYYGLDGNHVILLLGGDKSTQGADIKVARGYWIDYKQRVRKLRNKRP